MPHRTPNPTDTPHENETPLDEVTATYVPRTELGRKLLALRAEAVKSGIPLLDWDEFEREIAERRGGTALWEYEERQES
jgi:hypothetical protein